MTREHLMLQAIDTSVRRTVHQSKFAPDTIEGDAYGVDVATLDQNGADGRDENVSTMARRRKVRRGRVGDRSRISNVAPFSPVIRTQLAAAVSITGSSTSQMNPHGAGRFQEDPCHDVTGKRLVLCTMR